MLLTNLLQAELRQRMPGRIADIRYQLSDNPNLSQEHILDAEKVYSDQHYKGNFEIQSSPRVEHLEISRDQVISYFPQRRNVAAVGTIPITRVVYPLDMTIQSNATRRSIERALSPHIELKRDSLIIYHCNTTIKENEIENIKEEVKTLTSAYESIVSQIDAELEKYYELFARKVTELISEDQNRRDLEAKLNL